MEQKHSFLLSQPGEHKKSMLFVLVLFVALGFWWFVWLVWLSAGVRLQAGLLCDGLPLVLVDV